MNIGAEFKFPEGFGSFSSDQTLYLIDNSSQTGRMTCVEFVIGKNTRRADFHFIPRDEFEQGLLDGRISVSETRPELPAWLEPIKGLNLETFEVERAGAKRSNYELAQSRVCIIKPLADRADEVFAAEDPARFIAEWVRGNAPDQNATRVRFWFACYLTFGRTTASLYPSLCWVGRICLVGRKGRKERPAGKLPGRVGRVRRERCRSDKDMQSKAQAGYVKHANLGISEKAIYAKTLETEFGCKVVGKGDKLRIISPDNRPYPTFHQFRYAIRKKFRPDMLRETRYGAARVRNKMTPDIGRFSEGVANLFEKVEADGDYLDEQLVDFDGLPFGDSFCKVRLVDDATGCNCGIGFAPGAEVLSAYKTALFCAAVPKSFFGRLFGLEISDEEWPCLGSPAQVILDRGQGAGKDLLESKDLIPFIEMVGSHQPKSKATVESSNTRTTKLEGAPLTFQSKFNPVDAAKREILRLIKDNWDSDASERMTPAMIRDGVAPNPTAIWAYLDRRARTSGREIPVEEAIRAFLTPVQFTVTRDSVKLGHRRFDSAELRDSGLRAQIPKGQTVKVSGYAMNLCVRAAWIEVNHRLVEVQALLPIRDDERQLYVSLDYLLSEKDARNQLKAEQAEFNVAATMKYNQACEAATGKAPTAGRWRAGKKKRSPERKAAARVTRKSTMPQ